MGSGCTRNAAIGSMPDSKYVFYVANASRHRLLVATSDSMAELDAAGLHARLKVNSDIPFVDNIEFNLGRGKNPGNGEASVRQLAVGELSKFSAKFYAISRIDGKGKEHLMVKEAVAERSARSVIVGDDRIVMSDDLKSGESSRRNNNWKPEEMSSLRKKAWISFDDNKDLRPREFFVANASDHPIHVLPSDDPPSRNAAVGDFDNARAAAAAREVQPRRTWTFSGDGVTVLDKDRAIQICRRDTKARQSIVVVGQSAGDYLVTHQLEGDNVEDRKWVVDGKSYARGWLGKKLPALES